MKQLSLHPSLKHCPEFGGDLLKGVRKSTRPISIKNSMHTTLRANEVGSSFLLPRNIRLIRQAISSLSNLYGVRVYESSINSNHLHLLTKTRTREGYRSFLRTLSGTLAMQLTGAKKGAKLIRKFWAHRPWSRIVQWWRAFKIALNYVIRNQMESTGQIAYVPRNRLRKFPPTG